MSQPHMLENYDHLLDTTNLWNFENETLRIEEPEDIRTNPSAEGMESDHAGDNNDDNNGQHSGKKAIRHTQYQIQELLTLFEKSPKPSLEQREELGRVIGLTQLQVKFWCQNRRSIVKRHHKIQEVGHLKSQIERLRAENAKYKEAMGTTCLKCGGGMTLSERRLIAENARLKDEIGKIFAIASKHVREPLAPTYSQLPSSSHPPHQFQARSSPVRPAPMPSEGRDAYHLGWNHFVNKPTVMAEQSDPEAPIYSPHDACNLTLMITDPQDGAS